MTSAEMISLERLAEAAIVEASRRYIMERNRTDVVTPLELAWKQARDVAEGTLNLISEYRREGRETR